MQTHLMKIMKEPFEKIKNGSKTIEVRLYDEKRQSIRVGDKIDFRSIDDPSLSVNAIVVFLDKFDSFRELFNNFPANKFGNMGWINYSKMYEYYSKKDEKKYGTLAIGIKIT